WEDVRGIWSTRGAEIRGRYRHSIGAALEVERNRRNLAGDEDVFRSLFLVRHAAQSGWGRFRRSPREGGPRRWRRHAPRLHFPSGDRRLLAMSNGHITS